MHGLNELGFKALRLFVAVLDHGSFSEVARREGVAPSSISRQIQLMEQALNQQLLYRHTRAVTPTEAGRCSATTRGCCWCNWRKPNRPCRNNKASPPGWCGSTRQWCSANGI